MVYEEGSHSGLVRLLGKQVWGNPPGVRISPSPHQIEIDHTLNEKGISKKAKTTSSCVAMQKSNKDCNGFYIKGCNYENNNLWKYWIL